MKLGLNCTIRGPENTTEDECLLFKVKGSVQCKYKNFVGNIIFI